ncbi:hypothetical protein Tsubulata_021985 [Turnera subulata]|uniref:phosphopyruvate hydratase n=1 Tax=Turnera subulata TaxID=218843 RepID=A0A9Q0F3J6_9ROSI|nr:hypothetical protein Tsubulata_021985 [Turnera subulata]
MFSCAFFSSLEIEDFKRTMGFIFMGNLDSQLGANVILAVSCCLQGWGHVKGIPLYKEFVILPYGASSFKEAMKMGAEVYHHLKVANPFSL